jgi:excisionase family DNA binding protein
MKTLNFIPLPQPKESASSVIRRLADHNGYSTVSKFGAYFFGYGHSLHGNSLVEGNRYESIMLSQIGPALYGRIRQAFYALAEKDAPTGALMLEGVKVGRRLLRARACPVCSECRKSENEHFITDLCLCRHCPVHQRKLLFECPKCKRILTLKNQGSMQCACGSTWNSPECSESECLPERRMMAIFDHSDQRKFDSLVSIISDFGVPRNKIRQTSHSIVDAATAIVFEDIPRLEQILPGIWKTLDVVHAEKLSINLRKLHPSTIALIDSLAQKKSSDVSQSQPLTVTATDMRLMLGVTSRLWAQFLEANETENRKNYSYADIERLRQPIDDFTAAMKEKKYRFQMQTVTDCHTLEATSTLLKITRTECRALSKIGVLTPVAKIRSRPYYDKDSVTTFQASFISTRMLASQLGMTTIQIINALIHCESIKPQINGSGTPYLIRTNEIQTVLEALNTTPPRTNSLKDQLKVIRCNAQNMPTITLDQAADHLRVHRSTVIYYRDIGLIRCSTANSRVFAFEDVSNFNKLYATPSALGKELYIPTTKVTRVLEAHKVRAISGKFVNGNVSTIYDRRQLPANLYDLINPTHDTFGICISLNRVMPLSDAAKELGISHEDMKKIVARELRPARVPHYRGHGSVSYDEIASIKKQLSSLSSMNDILEAVRMTHAAFSRRFVSSGLIRPLKFNSQEFLTPADVKKLHVLIDKYCSLKEAAKMLRLSSTHVSLLIKEKKIRSYCILKQRLIKRTDVLAALKTREAM